MPKVALKSAYDQVAPDEAIVVFDGVAKLVVGETRYEGSVIVSYQCLPIAGRYHFEFRSQELPFVGLALVDDLPSHLEFDAFEVAQSCNVSIHGSSDSTDPSKRHAQGLIHGGFISSGHRAKRLIFHLLSYPQIHGDHLCHNPGDIGGWRGGVEFSNHKYSIRIDGLFDEGKKIQQARKKRQLLISHVGEIVRSDNSHFSEDDIAHVRRLLSRFLMLCRGTWAGPQLIVGMDGNEQCLIDLESTYYGRGQQPGGWLHEQIQDGYGCFAEFSELNNDPESSEVLWHVLYWYVQANQPGSAIETSLIVGQAALENLAYWLLVVVHRTVSNAKYDKMTAAQRIRMLVRLLNLDRNVPEHFESLRRFTATLNVDDGPQAITKLRNCLVHPTPENRQLLQPLAFRGKYELLQLTLKYVELGILRWVQYGGKYFNRCGAGEWATDNVELVPWG